MPLFLQMFFFYTSPCASSKIRGNKPIKLTNINKYLSRHISSLKTVNKSRHRLYFCKNNQCLTNTQLSVHYLLSIKQLPSLFFIKVESFLGIPLKSYLSICQTMWFFPRVFSKRKYKNRNWLNPDMQCTWEGYIVDTDLFIYQKFSTYQMRIS